MISTIKLIVIVLIVLYGYKKFKENHWQSQNLGVNLIY